MSPKSRIVITKKTPAAIPTASQMHKSTQTTGQIANAQKHVDKYTKVFGQIHKNIWTDTHEHLDKYTRTFGQIHMNKWSARKTLVSENVALRRSRNMVSEKNTGF